MITKKRTKEQLLSEEVLDAYINRPDFQYDVNGDALYRHYKDRYTQLGQTAMQDTMGQAAALTGGYGSSYAQNVGQQAYQGYMQQLGDVVPALYRLAYDRYRDKGETLYKTYQSLADQEQETDRRAQQDRTYALALKKYELEEQKDPEAAYRNQQSTEPQGDYYAWLAYHTGQGSLSDSTVTETHAYDNGNVSEGNIKTMQRVLGFKETGQWTQQNQTDAGGVTADQAWAAYQTGQLPNYKSVGVGLPIGNIKTMERILGLEEDGYWSAEDKAAAGGLSETIAWEAYQRGLLQERKSWGQRDVDLSKSNVKIMERILGLIEDGIWTEEDKKAAGGLSEANAWKAYQKGVLQNYKSKGIGEKGTSNSSIKGAEEILQLERKVSWLNREIANMDNMLTIYWDLTTREIGKTEEPKLEELRQQYSSPYELKDAIEKKKEEAKTLEKELYLFRIETQNTTWKEKYRGMTYTELKTLIRTLEDGAEKNWVANYAISIMTLQDAMDEAAKVDWLYNRLSALLDRYKSLTRWEQDAAGNAQIEHIASIYGSVTDLEYTVTTLRDQKYFLDNAVKYNYLSDNYDFKELSQFQNDGSTMYQMVNDIATASEGEVEKTIRQYVNLLGGHVSTTNNIVDIDNIQYMTSDELAIYNYVYVKEGEEVAIEYLEYLSYALNERAMNKDVEWVSEKTQAIPVVSQITASVLSTPLTLLGGLGFVDVLGQKFGNVITGEYKPIDYNRRVMYATHASKQIRETVAQNIQDTTGVIELDAEKHPILSQIFNGKGWADIYRWGMGVQDSAAVVALSSINPILGKTGTFLLSGSTSTQAMLDAVQRGADDEQAITIGIISGFFDMLFERYEIDDLLNADDHLIRSMGNQMINEFVGASATEVVDLATDYLVMAKNSDYEQNIQKYLAENPTWDYTQAEKQALMDSALKIAEKGIGETLTDLLTSLMEKR